METIYSKLIFNILHRRTLIQLWNKEIKVLFIGVIWQVFIISIFVLQFPQKIFWWSWKNIFNWTFNLWKKIHFWRVDDFDLWSFQFFSPPWLDAARCWAVNFGSYPSIFCYYVMRSYDAMKIERSILAALKQSWWFLSEINVSAYRFY